MAVLNGYTNISGDTRMSTSRDWERSGPQQEALWLPR
jgi:hypothetical protein